MERISVVQNFAIFPTFRIRLDISLICCLTKNMSAMPSSVIEMLISIFGISIENWSESEIKNAAELKGFVDPIDL